MSSSTDFSSNNNKTYSSENITDQEIILLSESLKYLPALQSLNLGVNQYLKLLKTNNRFYIIIYSGPRITDMALKCLGKALQQLTLLRYLKLGFIG